MRTEEMPDSLVLADIERLLPHAHRPTSRALLEGLRRKQQQPAGAPPVPKPLAREPAPAPSGPSYKPIAKYAFDQSAKFVKVYITLPGIEGVPDERIRLDVQGGGGLIFEVLGLPAVSPLAPNARLTVHSLHSRVDPANSSWTRKADSMLLLKLRKEAEGEEWGSLDDSARLKARKKEQDLQENKGKSTQELLSKMYAEADEEGKVSLSQAWEAGRAKREARRQQ